MIDALVIGGGPAGSLAAILLARGGSSVTLVEQSVFPRDKVCGECLSATGVDVLLRQKLLDKLFIQSPTRPEARLPWLHRAHIIPAQRVSVPLTIDLPRPMLGVSRSRLDQTLLDAARDAGVTVRQPARAESVMPDAREPSAVVRDIMTNEKTTIVARVVVVADGRAAAGMIRPTLTDDLGIKTHFTHVDADPEAVTLFGFPGCYGGVAPIEGDRWNVALAVPAALVRRHGGDLIAVWEALLATHPMAARAFASARRVTPWHASPLPRFRPAAAWPPGLIPVGNAAAALEPIGGEGMGLALRSAELASEAIIADGRVDTLTLRAAYAALWRTRSLACRAAARLLGQPAWAAAGIDLLDASPGLARAAARLMGKT